MRKTPGKILLNKVKSNIAAGNEEKQEMNNTFYRYGSQNSRIPLSDFNVLCNTVFVLILLIVFAIFLMVNDENDKRLLLEAAIRLIRQSIYHFLRQ